MAAKKPIEVEEEFEEEETFEPMVSDDGLTVKIAPKEEGYKGPKVTVFIPALEDSGSAGIKVDQYEHVTIANEEKETCYRVLRGEPVEVPVPVFIALKARYPKL